MAIFVDASALISMIIGEPDAADLSDRLERDADRLCSTVFVWEAVAGLVRSYGLYPSTTRVAVSDISYGD